MDEDEFSYKVLRKIQDQERTSPALTKINDTFYKDAFQYIQTLNNRMDKEKKTSRTMIIADQIQTGEKIIHNIYETREKKIILAAMAKARGGTPHEKHFLVSEEKLFSDIFTLIMNSRNKIFEDGDQEEIIDDAIEEVEIIEEKIETKPKALTIKDHQIIRVIEDIPSFIGTDTKQYDLRKGDIISMPKNLGEMLIQKQVAKSLG